MTKEEATLCLDLLREIPGPEQDTWDWLTHRAKDAGLTETDIAGLSIEDAIVFICDMERYWHMGPWTWVPKKQSLFVTKYEVKAHLVERLRLPLLCLRMSLEDILRLVLQNYEIDPRLRGKRKQVRDFSIQVPLPTGTTVTLEVKRI